MKVEHITLGGNSVIRDTSVILMETISLLKHFQIESGSKTLPFPRTDLTVKLTHTAEGAMFDIMKGSCIAIANVCCFQQIHAPGLMDQVRTLAARIYSADIVRDPELDKFIYSVPIAFWSLSPEEMQTAGEIELYIYYSLHLARR